MPFKSKSQMNLCFRNHPSGWDCEKWLKETPHPEKLPWKVGQKGGCDCEKRLQVGLGKIYTGVKGGKYTINKKGKKVYLKK